MRTTISGAILAFFLANCATVKHGPMQRISVDSKPRGASVKLSDCGLGSTDAAKTPAIVFVNRRATHCTLTFTHSAYGSRAASLVRTLHPNPSLAQSEVELGGALIGGAFEGLGSCGEDCLVIALPIAAVGAATMALGGVAMGIDGFAGANYRQNPSVVLIDFDKSVPDVAGRYSLESVNGKDLPTETWTTRNGTCLVHTKLGLPGPGEERPLDLGHHRPGIVRIQRGYRVRRSGNVQRRRRSSSAGIRRW